MSRRFAVIVVVGVFCACLIATSEAIAKELHIELEV